MYEHHTESLLPWRDFLYRLARHGGAAGLILLVSLGGGTIGFHALAPQSWLDAFMNASMLLGGMGLVGNIDSPEGKIFASLFALYGGIVFLGASVLVIAPVLHRLTHVWRIKEKRGRRK